LRGRPVPPGSRATASSTAAKFLRGLKTSRESRYGLSTPSRASTVAICAARRGRKTARSTPHGTTRRRPGATRPKRAASQAVAADGVTTISAWAMTLPDEHTVGGAVRPGLLIRVVAIPEVVHRRDLGDAANAKREQVTRAPEDVHAIRGEQPADAGLHPDDVAARRQAGAQAPGPAQIKRPPRKRDERRPRRIQHKAVRRVEFGRGAHRVVLRSADAPARGSGQGRGVDADGRHVESLLDPGRAAGGSRARVAQAPAFRATAARPETPVR